MAPELENPVLAGANWERAMKPIPENLPHEIQLVLLCRAVRRYQKRRLDTLGATMLIELERELDKTLTLYDKDNVLRQANY
jgi:hypothetical protein